MDGAVPRHVAIIMDGNGRWAEQRGLPRVAGHEEGAKSVDAVVSAARELGVQALTLYSFSTENWKRPPDEVAALMNLLRRFMFQERDRLLGNGIRLRVIGQTDRLPASVQAPLKLLLRDSARNRDMTLCLALSYGSRAEITEAVRSLAVDVQRGALRPDQIDEAMISARMSTAGLPDPDLLIRTSGELRISNFLLWQIAYTELYVTDTLWPDFRRPQLEAAFAAYRQRERRFGQTGAQVQRGPTP
jgi:undecaprenyl diphosphate synthase